MLLYTYQHPINVRCVVDISRQLIKYKRFRRKLIEKRYMCIVCLYIHDVIFKHRKFSISLNRTRNFFLMFHMTYTTLHYITLRYITLPYIT